MQWVLCFYNVTVYGTFAFKPWAVSNLLHKQARHSCLEYGENSSACFKEMKFEAFPS